MCIRDRNRNTDADLLETAVDNILARSIRTVDIAATGVAPVSTAEMGTALIKELDTVSQDS